MNSRVRPFRNTLRLNTGLMLNCLEGMSDAQANVRVLPSLNSVAFLLAHMTDARHTLLDVLGGSAANPIAPLLANVRGIDDGPTLPHIDVLADAWMRIYHTLNARMASLPPEVVDARAPQPYPGGDASVLGALAFLTQHDSYHLGQVALLRKALGLPVMRYGLQHRADTLDRPLQSTE